MLSGMVSFLVPALQRWFRSAWPRNFRFHGCGRGGRPGRRPSPSCGWSHPLWGACWRASSSAI